MIIETRKTAQGTEYWDNVEKKSLFVPAGENPRFEVTENPKSMIGESVKKESTTLVIEDMTVKELRAYATELDIEIPSDVTKKDDIIQLLYEAQ